MDTDYKKLAMYLANHMYRWFEKNAGYTDKKDYKAVIGISGGKDSAVAAAIACEALGKENVYGVIIPNGEQADIEDARKVCEFLDINWTIVNIRNPYFEMLNGLNFGAVGARGHIPTNFQADARVATNLPARLRMCVLYAVAAHVNGRVIGTGNLSESIAGYTTLYGDSACDYNPLAWLYVDEVIEVGKALGDIPEEILSKPPSDGMSGKTDEDNLGFTYADLKAVMVNRAGDSVSQEKRSEIMRRAATAGFKRRLLIGIPHAEIERHADGTINVDRTIDAFDW